MGKCRFSDADVVEYDALWNAPEFQDPHAVQAMREASSAPLSAPVAPSIATLDLMKVPGPKPASRAPRWMPWCCHNRVFFRRVIVRITKPAGEELYKFAFALRNPIVSGWHRVDEVHDVVEPTLEPGTWAEQSLHMRDHYFRLFIRDNRFSDDGLF